MSEVSKIELTVGTDDLITLPGHGAGGYQWSATVGDATIVDVVRIANVSEPRPARPGDSPSVAFSVRAKKPGTTCLDFRLARPWRPQEVIEEQTFDVIVT